MKFFEYLPVYELNHFPRILVAFEMDFLRNLEAFKKAIPKGDRFTMLLQLGWSAELPEVAKELKKRLSEAKEAFPEARFIILSNTAKEVEIIQNFSEVYLAQHNAFLDPKRYKIASKGPKKYDALYIARITPFKRHYLAKNIPNLHLIGSFSEKERSYFEDTIKDFSHAKWTKKVPSFFIPREIGKAACGLALSATEGAMFSCGEYTLCGIPVVNTTNLGGRDTLLPEFAVKVAEDTPESVANAVEYWVNNPIDPQDIRQEFIKKAQIQKDFVQDLVNSIAKKDVDLPHKLNVRCNLLPHVKFFHGIRKVN